MRTLWRQKNSKKVAQCRKKIEMRDPLGPSGFVGYVLKVKNQRGDSLESKKNFEKKLHSAEKNRKGRPFSPVRFCRLRLESRKPKGGPFGIT